MRYHTNLVGTKDRATSIATCCEVTNTAILSRLPEFLYSIAGDGVYVNMYADSSIAWGEGADKVTLDTSARVPKNTDVAIRLSPRSPRSLRIYLRMPSWATGNVEMFVNDRAVGSGVPGTYVPLARTWDDGDVISFTVPTGFRLHKYLGFERDARYDRYALQYGPLLLSLVGTTHVSLSPEVLLSRLSPVPGTVLHFNVAGCPGCEYMPYFEIGEQTFTSYPTFNT